MSQHLWIGSAILAIATLIFIYRGLVQVATKQTKALGEIGRVLASMYEAEQNQRKQNLLKERTIFGIEQIEKEWGPRNSRGDWQISVTGLTVFASPANRANNIEIRYPCQEDSIALAISNEEHPRVTVTGCAILKELGLHDIDNHTDSYDCEFDDASDDVADIFQSIGSFLSRNPTGFSPSSAGSWDADQSIS